MKFQFKYVLAALVASLTMISCNDSDDSAKLNELDGLTKIKEFANDNHTIELYTNKGSLEQGYNDVMFRIKNNADGKYVKNANANWLPIMHMTTKSHSCPKSAISKPGNNETLYKGYIVFQMPQNPTEYWDLKIDYSIDGSDYSATSVIEVPASAKRTVTTFTGTDGVKYIMALVAPTAPKVAVNDMKVGVFKMQDMMTFPVVDGYTVKIDPRMPSMGNHSSPNNVNPVQAVQGGLYDGKLSLTMTGYWKINLQLANATGTVVKGEEITDTVEASSIFFEVEF